MPRPLKVFRAHLGFYDTVVAVPSQKAAAEAWGGMAASGVLVTAVRTGITARLAQGQATAAALREFCLIPGS